MVSTKAVRCILLAGAVSYSAMGSSLPAGAIEGAVGKPALLLPADDGRTSADVNSGHAQVDLSDVEDPHRNASLSRSNYLRFYFHNAGAFSTDVPPPDEVTDTIPGEAYLSPEAINGYLQKASERSDKITLKITGHTYENRPLLNAYISSPENIKNLEKIRTEHLEAGNVQQDAILVVKLSYSIHGNEPSGANAVPLIVYYLLTSTDPWVSELLKNTVIVIEPIQNPDGLVRFSQWVSANQAVVENYDPAQRDHHAPWPSGRTNHYLFDLNRDWIFGVQPESLARLGEYYRWRPHILGDYHEMGGSKPSYFFQPGHARRTHPLTTAENQEITKELAKYHARALDETGQDYFTQERFDDFYYGKGSAYPDITGGIGLLFEQTAAGGLVRDFKGEHLSFRQTVANQVSTSLSLLRGANALRSRIIAYRFSFRAEEERRSKASQVKGYVFSDGNDPERALMMRKMLAANNIEVFDLARSTAAKGKMFSPGSAWIVPTNPRQFGIVTSLFETRTSFIDNVFYDVSTWNLPLSFGVDFAPVKSVSGLVGKLANTEKGQSDPIALDRNAVAIAVPWTQLDAPKFLETILSHKIYPRVATLPFASRLTEGSTRSFAAGTIVVRTHDAKAREAVIAALRADPSLRFYTLDSGLTPDGPDLGSSDMKAIHPVSLAVIVGKGVDTEEAGEIWHLFDRRIGAPITLLDTDRVKTADLSRYTHLLFPDGQFADLAGSRQKLRQWVQAGGTIIAQKGSATWAFQNVVCDASTDASNGDKANSSACQPSKESSTDEKSKPAEGSYRAFGDYEYDQGEKTVAGAILDTRLDLTHPYAFGFSSPNLPVFCNWDMQIARAESPYDTPVRYVDAPLLSGYLGKGKQSEFGGSPVVALHRLGKGYVVAIADDLNFRGIWHATSRIYLNTIYFTQIIEDR